MYLVAEYIQMSAPRDNGRCNDMETMGHIKACGRSDSFQVMQKGCNPTPEITRGGETQNTTRTQQKTETQKPGDEDRQNL